MIRYKYNLISSTIDCWIYFIFSFYFE